MPKRRKSPTASRAPADPARQRSLDPRAAARAQSGGGSGGTGRPLERRRLFALLGVVLLAVLAAVLVVAHRSRTREPLAALPLPSVPDSEPLVSSAGDFVGSAACAACHPSQVAAWSSSTHARAGGKPGSVRILPPFDGTPIRFRDAEVVPIRRGGVFTFTVRRPGVPDVVLRVDGVVGGGHMVGGGTQGFVSRWIDGTVRFLPFDFIRQEHLWFCNTATRANRGWVAITPSLALADCGDWPPTRVLGDDVRFANCQSCHGSQIQLVLGDSGGYRTTIGSLGVNCESCHGPARRHLAAAGDSAALARGELAMASLGVLDKDASLATCWQCHAVKDQLRPGFVSGQPLERYYSVHLAQLGDAPHLPDGRVRTFAYQQGHLYSDCYVNGGMTCTSCHDPHAQSYRGVTGQPLVGRFDDRQCTSCHASKAERPERHTHHPAASEGSRCTSCHMPYLQQREVGATLHYARSDHAIPIPRPLADSSLGVRSACQTCHRTWTERALDDTVRRWYGSLKPRNPTIDAVLAWQADQPLPVASAKLLDTSTTHAAAQVAGLATFIEAYVSLDTPRVHVPTVRRLQAIATRGQRDARAMSLAALHALFGQDPDVRQFLASTLHGLGAEEQLVRDRWSTTLGFLADRHREQGDPVNAIVAYQKALEIKPSHPRLHLNLGLAYRDAGRTGEAIESYRRSLRLDMRQPLAQVNLGIALAASGDASGAAAAYREALRLNPLEPLAHFNLGNLHLRGGDLVAAEASYRRATAADPSLVLGQAYLGRILGARGDFRGGLAAVDQALAFDPTNPEARQLRAQLLKDASSRR